MLWINSETKSIESSSLPTSNDRFVTKLKIFSSPRKVEHFAVDWVHDNVYWTDSNSLSIHATSLTRDRGESINVITENLAEPQAILVYPAKYFLFWVDLGDSPR